MNIFENKKQTFLNVMYEYQYIFEIKKCCGYTEWITVYKDDTLEQLYKNVFIQFKTYNKNIIRLFLINQNNEKIELENSNISLRNYIRNNPELFQPIYPIPCWIVYPIYLDDGSCHLDHSTEIINCNIHNECV
jgi:hypothetical protein